MCGCLHWNEASVSWLVINDSVSDGPGKTDRDILDWADNDFIPIHNIKTMGMEKQWCGVMQSVDPIHERVIWAPLSGD